MATLSTSRFGPHILPLENGDHLTRDEFERRYAAMIDVKKAELVEGIVYLGSRVKAESHGIPHADLIGVFGLYRVYSPHVHAADNATVRLDWDNEFQPDITLFIDPEHGGQATLNDDYITDAPELVAEISASSASIDLGKKFHVYRRNGVREYVVWRVLDRAIDWFVLRGSDFERLTAGADGILRSEVFPGLWLDAEALLSSDLPRVHNVLHEGLASPEHKAFVKKLNTE